MFNYQSLRGRGGGFRGHWRGNFGQRPWPQWRQRPWCQPGWWFQPERQLFKLASSSVAGQTEEVQSSNLNKSPNCENTKCTSEFKNKLVGRANVGRILICGVETTRLINSGSIISTISESFYRSMDLVQELGDTKGVDLAEYGANGSRLAYCGYIKADVSVPILGPIVHGIPILVVKDTEYNKTVPAIIGTNIIREYTEYRSKADTPLEWQTALDSLCDSAIPVKTTNNFTIRVGPGEVKTVNGIARKTGEIDAAVTEHINNSLSGDLTICPRVVSLKSLSTS